MSIFLAFNQMTTLFYYEMVFNGLKYKKVDIFSLLKF